MFISVIVIFQNLEWDLLDFSALAIGAFTCLEISGLYCQNQKIWQRRSGLGLSNVSFIYHAFMFASIGIYGLGINSMTMALTNGLIALAFLPILTGLYRFNVFSAIDYIVLCFCAILLSLMFFSGWGEEVLYVFTVGSVLALFVQWLEFRNCRSLGSLELKLLLIYFFSSLAWMSYAWLIDERLLSGIFMMSFLILGVTIATWLKRYYHAVGNI